MLFPNEGVFDFSEALKETGIEFKRGIVISLKHSTIFEPVLSVIQKIEGRNIFFRVPDEFLKSNVLKGDGITCHVFQNEFEYVVSGFISDIDISYPYFVQVYADKIQKFRNYRQAKRFPVSFPAYVHNPTLERSIYAIIKNISSNGIAAVFKEHINIDSRVGLKVLAQLGKKEVLEFKARIVRAIPRNNYSEYGMEICEIDELNKDRLDKVLYHLQENEATFISDSLK